jgi:NTE family protein
MNDRNAPDRPARSVAVVIGSGSVKCAAALGLVRVLQREGIRISQLVGCSGGAIYASIVAMGLSIEECVAASERLWTREVTAHGDRRALLRVLMPKVFGFDSDFGLRSDELVLARLREAFGDTRIEDLPTPLHLTATDFANGELTVFSRGSLVDAVRASMAVPFLFRPWKIDGRLYLDGYMADPLPVGVAMREGAQTILAMGFESPYEERISSGARFAFQVSSILSNNLLKSQFAFHALAHHAEVIPIIPEFRQRIHLFDTAKLPYIIEEGERAAEAQMPYLLRLLATEDREERAVLHRRATS